MPTYFFQWGLSPIFAKIMYKKNCTQGQKTVHKFRTFLKGFRHQKTVHADLDDQKLYTSPKNCTYAKKLYVGPKKCTYAKKVYVGSKIVRIFADMAPGSAKIRLPETAIIICMCFLEGSMRNMLIYQTKHAQYLKRVQH